MKMILCLMAPYCQTGEGISSSSILLNYPALRAGLQVKPCSKIIRLDPLTRMNKLQIIAKKSGQASMIEPYTIVTLTNLQIYMRRLIPRNKDCPIELNPLTTMINKPCELAFKNIDYQRGAKSKLLGCSKTYVMK